MKALYATNTVVSRDGNALAIMFENNTSMTAVKVSRNTAERLIADLRTLIDIEDAAK